MFLLLNPNGLCSNVSTHHNTVTYFIVVSIAFDLKRHNRKQTKLLTTASNDAFVCNCHILYRKGGNKVNNISCGSVWKIVSNKTIMIFYDPSIPRRRRRRHRRRRRCRRDSIVLSIPSVSGGTASPNQSQSHFQSQCHCLMYHQMLCSRLDQYLLNMIKYVCFNIDIQSNKLQFPFRQGTHSRIESTQCSHI